MTRKAKNNGTESGSFHLPELLEEAWRRCRKASKRAKSEISEESIHELRVSLRRLEAAMDFTQPIAEDQMRKARKRLTKLLSSLNPLRDVQVQLLAVNELTGAYPDVRSFQKKLLKKEQSLSRELREELNDRLRKLKASFDEALADCRTTLDELQGSEMRRLIADGANDAFMALTETVKAIDPLEIATIHRTRVAFKKFRYMIQAAQPVLRDTPEVTLQHMHDLQTTLGSLHDTDMLLEALQKWDEKRAKRKQRALEPLYEMLAERRRGAMEEALSQIQEVHTFWQPREKRLSPPVRAGA